MDNLVAMLERLKTDVPSIRELKVGRNVVHGPKSFDIYYYARFDDADGFAAYMKHPLHLPVMAYVEQVCSDVADVDVFE